ncbi:MAG: hypothetical protein KF858_00690 [Candidatus Sumerlaeia bacterium]|nr:hypothetical protein [Candidatus Sumerlaeia bacterium]
MSVGLARRAVRRGGLAAALLGALATLTVADPAAPSESPANDVVCFVSTRAPEYPARLDHGPWPDPARLAEHPWIGGLWIDGVWQPLDVQLACTAVPVGGIPFRIEGQRISFSLAPAGHDEALAFEGELSARGELRGIARGADVTGGFVLARQGPASPANLAEALGIYETALRDFTLVLADETRPDAAWLVEQGRFEPLRPVGRDTCLTADGRRLLRVRDHAGAVAQMRLGPWDDESLVGVRRTGYRIEQVMLDAEGIATTARYVARDQTRRLHPGLVLLEPADADARERLVADHYAMRFAALGYLVIQVTVPAEGGDAVARAARAHLAADRDLDPARVALLAHRAAVTPALGLLGNAETPIHVAVLVSPPADVALPAADAGTAALPLLLMLGGDEPDAAPRAESLHAAALADGWAAAEVLAIAGAGVGLRLQDDPAHSSFALHPEALRELMSWFAENMPEGTERAEPVFDRNVLHRLDVEDRQHVRTFWEARRAADSE